MIDVLVIGSGYGGSVIAARLAARGSVVVVERGRWWRPGELPTSLADLARAYRGARHPGGLWSMRLGRGTGVAFASAVGGSSPVNYGITARPDDHAFEGWPVSAAELAPWYGRAREVLRPEPDPLADELGDRAFLDLVEPGRRVDLENTIDWSRCTRCGRCVPGCNVGAKRTLDETYLGMAIRAGAALRAETEARDLVPVEGGYAVELRPTAGGPSEWVCARHVVLAAGTLGTLDLLHRSRIPVGPMFGQRISLNGDALAVLYDSRHDVSSHSGAPVSTSARIPFVGADGKVRTLMVMSGRVPRAAMRVAAAALGVVADLAGEGTPRAGQRRRQLRDLAEPDSRGAMSHSFLYKLDAQDEGRGAARFTPGGVVVDWEDYVDDPILRFAEDRLRGWAAVAGGIVVPNVGRLPGMRGFSVHPLGGCRMGRTIEDSVVDDVGRVRDPRGGLHPGLRIADGSIVPGALGVPPSWTIAALAERIADDMAHELQP